VLKTIEAGFHFARARTIQLEVHPEESLSGPKDLLAYTVFLHSYRFRSCPGGDIADCSILADPNGTRTQGVLSISDVSFFFSHKSLRFVQFSWLPNWARFDAEDREWSASTTTLTPPALHEICVVSHSTRSDGPWRCTLGCSCDNPALYPLPRAVRDLLQPVMAPAPNGVACVVGASPHNGTLDHQPVARARDGVHSSRH